MGSFQQKPYGPLICQEKPLNTPTAAVNDKTSKYEHVCCVDIFDLPRSLSSSSKDPKARGSGLQEKVSDDQSVLVTTEP